LNIELITLADLVSVDGQAGKFKVKVNKRARYIDPELCTACGICYVNCPVTNEPYPKEAQEMDS
jgi:heterodisulfide reductase subunit A2